MVKAYYNENDPFAAQWLRNLIDAGHIAPGDVDDRSIVDVRADDLRGYTQCHFFAGIGGWSFAARLAGWPDSRPIWTGSCPCQPFSVAGKGEGQKDERHLWPVFFKLIRSCRPDVVMGEQVAAAAGKGWLDGVHTDLEGVGYACGATVVPACAVDAPHRRDRLWFVADAGGGAAQRRGGPGFVPRKASQVEEQPEAVSQQPAASNHCEGDSGLVGYAVCARLEGHARDGDRCDQPGRIEADTTGSIAPTGGALSDADQPCAGAERQQRSREQRWPCGNSSDRPWARSEWAVGADGKARRVEPGIRLLAHGVPARVGKLRAYGNAIVPQVAAEIIGAYLDLQAAA